MMSLHLVTILRKVFLCCICYQSCHSLQWLLVTIYPRVCLAIVNSEGKAESEAELCQMWLAPCHLTRKSYSAYSMFISLPLTAPLLLDWLWATVWFASWCEWMKASSWTPALSCCQVIALTSTFHRHNQPPVYVQIDQSILWRYTAETVTFESPVCLFVSRLSDGVLPASQSASPSAIIDLGSTVSHVWVILAVP